MSTGSGNGNTGGEFDQLDEWAASGRAAEPAAAPDQPAEPTDEVRHPGELPPAPRGWTKQEWEQSFYGAPKRDRHSPLSVGRGWLYVLVLVVVLALLIAVLVATH